MRRRIHAGAVVFGLIVMTLGGLFLLDTTGAAKNLFSDFWPVVLLLLGAWLTVQERGRGFFGPIVFLLGLGFLLQNLDVIGEGWIGRYWPVAIIVFGVAIVGGTLRSRSAPGQGFLTAHPAADEWLEAVAVLGGHKERVRSASWHGGRATAVMGGVELDLRDAHTAPEGAVLHVSTFMGGVSVTVPESWEVTMHGTPFLGGFEDKTRHGTATEEASKLEITGTMVLGGVEVKN
jgi:hypothetical protein